MPGHREFALFALTLAALVIIFFYESLLGGRILSPADVLFVSPGFHSVKGKDYEPKNRLLMDPVLQFEPWLEFNRAELRAGRLPLWNPYVGCGAPHLANGQSAVFDPFHLLAYLGRLPDALAPMAAARLFFAGIGMYVLAVRWGFRFWGRWFAGLTFPFCGFLVAWLLYPVTGVAVWMPWVFWSSDRVFDRPGSRRLALLAFCVAGCLFGGHVQTAAHVLLATALYITWRTRASGPDWGRRLRFWAGGTLLGIGIAAISIVPLGVYLTRSPVWTDRALEKRLPWSLSRPRVLEMVCTGLPYAYGSQRRGHPNLAHGVGVDNLNESAGGFVGLATLCWLAPLSFVARHRGRTRWLLALTVIGTLGAFRWPPVDNILRSIPVLDVTDNRRLTLWVAFGLCLLGGAGLDRLGAVRRGRWGSRLVVIWLSLAILFLTIALLPAFIDSEIRSRIVAHYAQTSRSIAGVDPSVFQVRAARQIATTLSFLPRYYGLAAVHVAGLALALMAVRKRYFRKAARYQCGLVVLVLVDLFGFGYGLNPAIDPVDVRPITPLIEHLRRVAPFPARIVGVGDVLLPNTCMRYGLCDIRNYDSIELAGSVHFFSPLYPANTRERTSRREITWERIIASRRLLERAGVRAVVGATSPPGGAFDDVRRIGEVYVAAIQGVPPVFSVGVDGSALPFQRPDPRTILPTDRGQRVATDETWDIGWTGAQPPAIGAPPFLMKEPKVNSRSGAFRYDPAGVRYGAAASVICLTIAVFALTRFGLFSSTRMILTWLRWNSAHGLESDSSHPLPDVPTGENARKKR